MRRPLRSATSTGQATHARRGALAGGLLAGGVIAVLMAVGAMLGFSSPAWAATPATSLTLRAEPAPRDPHGVELVATLSRPGGSPAKSGSLAGDSVSFSVQLTQFAGAPLLTLGSSTTDAAGEAVLTYHPTWTGRQVLVATATSTASTTLASATTTYSAARAAHPFAGTVQAVRPDGTIGRAVVGVLLATVALLWIALISVVVRVNLGLTARRD